MIFPHLKAEARCDEAGCTAPPKQGELVLSCNGVLQWKWKDGDFGEKAWQLAPDTNGMWVTFCEAHRKHLSSLYQVGPSGKTLNRELIQKLKGSH